MKADLLRKKFLEFFKSKKHKIITPDSLVPKDDPTVLFTPAGMNQFKREFMGHTSGFKRAATCQRCLRTDDLEKVGKTAYHHTFFEMLGNFSFGDYFKEEAIGWAWEFLTGELEIPADRLWVSVYQDDAEAYNIWKDKIKVPAEKIIKLGDKENFWPSEAKEKGPSGPCGPCSEIFYDFGSGHGCGKPDCSPACNCGRFVEVWNLVFTQFNRKEGGKLDPLPNKNIDTGMGLERLAAVMQGVYSNFETDLFMPIIKEIVSKCQGVKVSENKPLLYAVADHLRAITFAIYDGVMPSNEDRGYVVRKIIRKSVLALRALGIREAFLYKLVPVLAETMHEFYPELAVRRENIAEIILNEEKAFSKTLNSSGTLFKEKFADRNIDVKAAGMVAFQLYDTYGIPLELTLEWAQKEGIKIQIEAFNQELEAQKNRSKLESKLKGDVFSAGHVDLGLKNTVFQGYHKSASRGKILKILKENTEVKKITSGEKGTIILDKTPFYAESGGQVGDTGILSKGKNIFEVTDTQKVGSVIVHQGRVRAGTFKKSEQVSAEVDARRRLDIARNHTATHLLQAALRKVLGEHVKQQGSLVAPDRLRFDFTHFKGLEPEQLNRVEELVNEQILDNYKLSVNEMTLSQAKKKGALAFFQEKYASKVRVVQVSGISSELCGGTHLEFTGEIGVFKILQESSIASGIRRIEAATGRFAYERFKQEERALNEVAVALGVAPDKVTQELEKKLSRVRELEKQLHAKSLSASADAVDTLISNAAKINEIKVITNVTDGLNMDVLRRTVDLIKQKTNSAVIVLGSGTPEGKAYLVMGLTPDLCTKGLDASKLINEVAKVIGGSGGGRKDFAQAGGTLPKEFPAAFSKLKEIVKGVA